MINVINFFIWFIAALFWWKIFQKANIKGWKALIPFYCDYVRFGMADKRLLYFPFLILSAIEFVVNFVYTSLQYIEFADALIEQINIDSDLETLFWIHLVLSMVIFVIKITVGIKIAAKFNKSSIFGVGLGMIPIVFAPILAFDNSVYKEEREI